MNEDTEDEIKIIIQITLGSRKKPTEVNNNNETPHRKLDYSTRFQPKIKAGDTLVFRKDMQFKTKN